jgi:hypothetical protein
VYLTAQWNKDFRVHWAEQLLATYRTKYIYQIRCDDSWTVGSDEPGLALPQKRVLDPDLEFIEL